MSWGIRLSFNNLLLNDWTSENNWLIKLSHSYISFFHLNTYTHTNLSIKNLLAEIAPKILQFDGL